MLIGYARVSTAEQNLDLQKDALARSGCEKIVEETAGGAKQRRSGLDLARELLRPGDVLVVWRLDRLGRSLKHLIELMLELEGRGGGFRSLQESIDTTTPGGKLVFHVLGALAEFERNLIGERTRARLAAARARGRTGGRPQSLDDGQKALAVDLYRQKRHSIAEICRTVGISKPTLYAYVREAGKEARREEDRRERSPLITAREPARQSRAISGAVTPSASAAGRPTPGRRPA